MLTGKNHHLKKSKSGVYYIHWQDGRSCRKSTGETDQFKANVFMLDQLTKKKESNDLTVREIIYYYLNNHVADSVVAKGRQMICATHLIREIGGTEIQDELSVSESILEYKRVRIKTVKSSTVRREVNMLSAALNFGADSKLFSKSLLPTISLPDESAPKDVWLNEEQSNKFLEIAKKQDRRIYLFCMIALETAARKDSILGLGWNKVNIQDDIIDFGNGVVTKKRKVKLPISSRLRETLINEYEAGDDYVFGYFPSFYRRFDLVVSRFTKETNWTGGRITPHTLRHTWATQAARAGVSMWEIAGVLGDTITTVSRVYAHHSPDHLRNAVNFRDKKN